MSSARKVCFQSDGPEEVELLVPLAAIQTEGSAVSAWSNSRAKASLRKSSNVSSGSRRSCTRKLWRTGPYRSPRRNWSRNKVSSPPRPWSRLLFSLVNCSRNRRAKARRVCRGPCLQLKNWVRRTATGVASPYCPVKKSKTACAVARVASGAACTSLLASPSSEFRMNCNVCGALSPWSPARYSTWALHSDKLNSDPGPPYLWAQGAPIKMGITWGRAAGKSSSAIRGLWSLNSRWIPCRLRQFVTGRGVASSRVSHHPY